VVAVVMVVVMVVVVVVCRPTGHGQYRMSLDIPESTEEQDDRKETENYSRAADSHVRALRGAECDTEQVCRRPPPQFCRDYPPPIPPPTLRPPLPLLRFCHRFC
jgi:hypothetical protein